MRSTSTSTPYDVVVIGGGSAGATAATFLSRQGHRCLILENSNLPRYHIGESLIPHTYGTLDRLGLLPKLQASAFPVKHSVRFVSPSGQHADPFYFSETIEGAFIKVLRPTIFRPRHSVRSADRCGMASK